MVLAKTDLAIARSYAQLVPGKAMRTRIFQKMEAEHALTLDMFQTVAHRQLLDDNQQLRAALSERFAYIEPLNHLQVELLRRHRAMHDVPDHGASERSEEHTSEVQSLMRSSYVVFCLTKNIRQ